MRRSLIASLLFALAWSAAALAQTAAPPTAPAAKRQVFSNWILICASAPGSTAATCEADATLQPDGGLPPVAKVAFVRNPKDQSVRLVAIVPANLTLAPGVEITDGADKSSVTLAFKSCLNSACLADAVLSAEQLQSFRSQSKQDGRLTIKNAGGESLSLPVPRSGLDEALAALLTQQGQ